MNGQQNSIYITKRQTDRQYSKKTVRTDLNVTESFSLSRGSSLGVCTPLLFLVLTTSVRTVTSCVS